MPALPKMAPGPSPSGFSKLFDVFQVSTPVRTWQMTSDDPRPPVEVQEELPREPSLRRGPDALESSWTPGGMKPPERGMSGRLKEVDTSSKVTSI